MDKYCTKCGTKMIMTIEGCENIGRWSITYEEMVSDGKQYRKDNGEEIKIRIWRCPNKKKRTQYNWFQIFIFGYPKYEDHDTKAEYINHDNPNAIIL